MEKLRPDHSRAVCNWVLLGAVMLCVQVILGGITRLTGSGLSITEWNIFTGAIPPLSSAQWEIEFAKYRQTPQFRLLNDSFSLADFRFIYFWEWFHRLWARLVGVVFLVGFFYLLAKEQLKKELIRPLLILFLLGALQGAVGWIMVLSGLTGDALYVKPLKLALHFIFALLLISYTWWFYLGLRKRNEMVAPDKPLKGLTLVILSFLFLQLIYGALMAGGKLAVTAPTWPTINGEWIPLAAFRQSGSGPAWLENKLLVHFIHRGLAYSLLILTLVWTLLASRPSSSLKNLGWLKALPLASIFIQVLLGILALFFSPAIIPNHWVAFDWIALAHQVGGISFLLVMVYMLFIQHRGGPAS